jgi:serine/threonine-protein kinase
VATEDLTGTVLDGRYRLGRRLDRGGPGGVYEAESLANETRVAIEVLPGKRDAKAFARAAAAAAKLEDKHTVGVLDYGTDGDHAFLVMQLVTGATLAEEIKRGRMAVPRAIFVLRQILRGLKHAHAIGLVHGGLTPRHVVVVKGEGIHDTVRLYGFGLGKPIGHEDPPAAELIKKKALHVDPTYMAPEQARGGKVDARTDLYAASVILFEMLAGKPPFAASQPVNVLQMHLTQAIPPLAEGTGPSFVPPEIDGLVRCGMAKDAADRPQSADEYLHAVDASMAVVSARDADTTTRIAGNGMSQKLPRLLKLSKSGVQGPAPARRSGGGVWTAVLVLLVVAAGAAGVYFWQREARPSSAEPARPAPAPARPTKPAKPAEPPAPAPARTPAPVPATPPVYAAALAEAVALTEARKLDAAEKKLQALAAEHPDGADIRRELGDLYLARNWPEPTLKNYRAALALDPGLREDAAIIRAVISLLDSQSRGWDAHKFLLEDVGKPAMPVLTDTVLNDPSAGIRNRAKAVLDKLKATP